MTMDGLTDMGTSEQVNWHFVRLVTRGVIYLLKTDRWTDIQVQNLTGGLAFCKIVRLMTRVMGTKIFTDGH
jgi:hypothetical protein